MALQGPIPIEFGMVFPDGAYAAGGIEMVRDFDRSSADRPVQQADKETGLPLWVVEVIDARLGELETEGTKVDADIAAASEGLAGLDQTVKALATDGSQEKTFRVRAAELAAREAELARLRARRAELGDEAAGLAHRRAQVEAGDIGDPRGHLRHAMHPQSTGSQQYGRLVEFWSAVSVSLGLIAFIVLVYLTSLPIWVGVVSVVVGYVVIEAAFRRQLVDLLLRLTLVMALIGAVVLVVGYVTELVILAIATVAVLTIIDNVREIRAS